MSNAEHSECQAEPNLVQNKMRKMEMKLRHCGLNVMQNETRKD